MKQRIKLFRIETVGTPFTLQMLGYLHNKYWGVNAHLGDQLAQQDEQARAKA